SPTGIHPPFAALPTKYFATICRSVSAMNSTIRVMPAQAPEGKQWSPVQGSTFTRLLHSNSALSSDEKEQLTTETLSILTDCIDPSAPASTNTGLVIGYVQSGKTLSFTSLA